MGGEKWRNPLMAVCAWGSPPHGRGKVAGDEIPGDVLGITPAQAGKSKLALCTPSCPTDHPRACGEKNKELEGVWLPMGSPPRGRGKVGLDGGLSEAVGITPAHAGKRTRSWRAYGCPWDHPRMGGEKHGAPASLMWSAGSPPRGRGKGVLILDGAGVVGITPA